MEPNKTTLLYFIVNGLQILGELNYDIKTKAIDYVLNNSVKDKEGSIQAL